jgi:hypothetical protein
MSRENLDLALLMYGVFNRRDLDTMLALAHDEVEIGSASSYGGQIRLSKHCFAAKRRH